MRLLHVFYPWVSLKRERWATGRVKKSKISLGSRWFRYLRRPNMERATRNMCWSLCCRVIVLDDIYSMFRNAFVCFHQRSSCIYCLNGFYMSSEDCIHVWNQMRLTWMWAEVKAKWIDQALRCTISTGFGRKLDRAWRASSCVCLEDLINLWTDQSDSFEWDEIRLESVLWELGSLWNPLDDR